MPALNGTGPVGRGPRTGRGLGWCPPDFGWRYGGFGGFLLLLASLGIILAILLGSNDKN